MPFPKQDPKPFIRERILSIAGNPDGCYGLYVSGREWVYVGSGDIKARLLAHLNGDNPCITNHQPTHWVDVVTGSYIETEKALILEFNPTCNKRIG